MRLLDQARIKIIFFIFTILALITPSTIQALTLTDSTPITVTQDGEVIENIRIHAINEPAILVNNHSNVVIRNVEITHEGGRGISCTGADGLYIENVSITNVSSDSPLPSENESNIECEFSSGIIIKNARLTGGSSGIYLLGSPNAHLSFIEGYNFRGPIPRGQLVQFSSSPSCTLEDFSAINNPDPSVSWPEDNVSVIWSDNCVIQRGLLDGNNSETGVGVMFEHSDNGLAEDVDTAKQGNGSFFAFPGNNVTFRRTRARDNICDDQGRGLPSSNGLVWGGDPSSTELRIEDSRYFNLCNPGNRVWDFDTFDIVEHFSEDFQLRDPIVNQFPWEVEDSVSADFSFSVSGLNVDFTDTSSSNSGNVVNWFWDFGDGGVSTSANPNHTYSVPGAYSVSLTVTDSNGASDTSIKNVAASEPPVADFTFSVSNLTANFTDISTDSDGTVADRDWNFGDGNTSTATNPSHTYDAEGTYSVSLIVTDIDGVQDSVVKNVTITNGSSNQVPNAGFTSSISGLNADFADTSTDSDGTIVSRFWSFGDGGSSTSQNPSHTYSSSGLYTVNLTVTDNNGASDTFSQSVTVIQSNQAPIADFSFNISGLNVNFTDTSSGNGDNFVNWFWDFGDGDVSTSANPNHTYSVPGAYSVSLTVTDSNGASDTSIKNVAASEPPVADFTFSVSNLTANFTDISTDSDGTVADRDWNFGDGNTSTATNPSHTYDAEGTYSVSLIVTDIDGVQDSVVKNVTITNGSSSQPDTHSYIYCFLFGGC